MSERKHVRCPFGCPSSTEVTAVLKQFLSMAWDGDPRRQENDETCQKAEAIIAEIELSRSIFDRACVLMAEEAEQSKGDLDFSVPETQWKPRG